MTISASDIKHVALLARLNISDEELEAYTTKLNDILESVEKLNELDTEDVVPTAHILPVVNVFREDEVLESIDREEAIKGAPDVYEGQFRVPKIV